MAVGLVSALCLAACSSSDSSSSESTRTTDSPASDREKDSAANPTTPPEASSAAEPTTRVPADTTTEAPSATAPADDADLVVESGFSSSINSIGTRNTTAGAIVTNPNAERAACDVQVTFTLKDAGGIAVDTTTERLAWVPKAARSVVAPLVFGFDIAQEPAALEITTIVDHFADAASLEDCGTFAFELGTTIPVITAAIERTDFGAEIIGQVTNDSDAIVQTASLDCVARTAGSIVGGASTAILDPIQPGQTIAFSTSWVSALPDSADSAECQVAVLDTAEAAAAELTVESGFSTAINSIGTRNTSAGAVITNPSTTQAACGVQVTFTLQDAAGAQVDTATERVPWIPKGAQILVAPLQIGFNIGTEPTNLAVATVVDSLKDTDTLAECGGFSMDSGIALDVSNAVLQQGMVPKITGQVTNPTDMLVETAFVDCILRAGGGIVGGTSTAILDPIQPGQTIAFETFFTQDITADSVACQIVV